MSGAASMDAPALLSADGVEELRQWLAIGLPGEDGLLTACLRSALDMCQQFTGRLLVQTRCSQIIMLSPDWQQLGFRPVMLIDDVTGIPAEGAEFALAGDAWSASVDADGTGSVRILRPGSAGRFRIGFNAGLAAHWADLPEGLRHGIIRMAEHLYAARARSGGDPVLAPPAAIAAMWQPWRVFNFGRP